MPGHSRLSGFGDRRSLGTMPTRAVQVTAANAPFEHVEREIPTPSPRWARIKVEACGVRHSDL